ncbi:MAG TPA: flagellar hook-associated protein FlgK [Rhizomicrobium sp.]|nr:flagellar hook-associated protein FlgK [Rhizomicrobium sp.]
MSLNGITNSALTALQTNQSALGVVSNNIANINTPGYARRVVNEQALSTNGQLMGVDIASVERVVNQFLSQENLTANGTSSQYNTEAQLFSQLNGLLGGPGDNQSLATGLTNLQAALATASQAPTASASQTGVANALSGLANMISNASSTITSLQGQIDQQVVSAVPQVNNLIQQVYNLNQQIMSAGAQGTSSSSLLDQRDSVLQSLGQMIGINVAPQSNGSVYVSTSDGVNLVSNTYATLSYSGGAQNGTYGSIQIQDTNPLNGQSIGQPQALDPDLGSGSLQGMVEMRDSVLGGLSQTLGNFAQQTAASFNAQSNANTAYPPASTLSGRDTGLLSADAMNFTGDTTIAVADSSGNLVSRIDVDFDAGTLSVDGGAPQSIGTTVGDFVTALNTALGSNGSASFNNGQLTISSAANSGDGIVVQDDASDPSSRGGSGFSQFFGLNDLFQSGVPSITNTGLSASDSSGLAAGGVISMQLESPDGSIVKPVSITTTAGQTIGDVVSALNTAMGGAVTFTLNGNGSISVANSPSYATYQLYVTGDTTQRGTTGLSFTSMFGLGAQAVANQAANFQVTSLVANSPDDIPLTNPAITSSSVAGDTIVESGDSAGAIALENVPNQTLKFPAAGGMAAQATSLSNFAAAFYQNLSNLSNTVTTNQTTQSDRLQEAQQQLASNSGVNLDEELTNLTTYQQAYSAAARVLNVVDSLYQTLLQM